MQNEMPGNKSNIPSHLHILVVGCYVILHAICWCAGIKKFDLALGSGAAEHAICHYGWYLRVLYFFLFYFISCVHCPHQYNSGLFRICCIFRLLIGRRWWWINNGVIAHSKQMFVCVVNSAEIQRKKSKQKRVFVNKWNFMLHSIICFLLILYEAVSLGNAGNGMIRHGQIRFDNATN